MHKNGVIAHAQKNRGDKRPIVNPEKKINMWATYRERHERRAADTPASPLLVMRQARVS